MKMPKLKTILLTPVILFIIAYIAMAVFVATHDNTAPAAAGPPASLETIAIFGASGTAGDGILKAALANPDIRKIHVITRRATPRIEAGVASGKVRMTKHMDYLDYAAIRKQMADVDAVFWAIGISSLGVDEDTYRRIHVDFDGLCEEWTECQQQSLTFLFTSSARVTSQRIPRPCGCV